MANGWTLERRAKQAELIRNWKPWQQSTGPRSAEGKAEAAQNAFKGGTWRELRDLSRQMSAMLKAQREVMRRVGKA